MDEEIVDFVKQYGSINRTISISDSSSESEKSLIVEFSSGLAVQTLQTMLPYVQQAKNNPDVSFHSGKNFEDVLKSMLAQMVRKPVPVLAEISDNSSSHLAVL